mmetsp:Transcript_2033/g.7430  ORF Transcript_2033/g.7430 Transcript_2033/m.7430 type:complete len:289 (+) Transcript_2033:571-1437(+)
MQVPVPLPGLLCLLRQGQGLCPASGCHRAPGGRPGGGERLCHERVSARHQRPDRQVPGPGVPALHPALGCGLPALWEVRRGGRGRRAQGRPGSGVEHSGGAVRGEGPHHSLPVHESLRGHPAGGLAPQSSGREGGKGPRRPAGQVVPPAGQHRPGQQGHGPKVLAGVLPRAGRPRRDHQPKVRKRASQEVLKEDHAGEPGGTQSGTRQSRARGPEHRRQHRAEAGLAWLGRARRTEEQSAHPTEGAAGQVSGVEERGGLCGGRRGQERGRRSDLHNGLGGMLANCCLS